MMSNLQVIEAPESGTQQKRKQPFSLRIQVNLYYDIPADSLPSWSTDKGVQKLVDEAFHDYNRKLDLNALSATGVLKLAPSEVTIEGIEVDHP
jgi:hypothetical protein